MYRYRYRADDLKWIDEDRRAFADYAQALRIRPSDANTLLGVAQLHFYRAKFSDAVSGFDQYLAAVKDDLWNAYAYIWRCLAAMRARADEASLLNKQAQSLKSHEWPYPVIEFYLGNIDESALLALARSGNAELQKNQVCEADAYIGELSLARGDTNRRSST